MRFQMLFVIACLMTLVGCGGVGQPSAPPAPAAGFEIYTENGAVARPNNAIDIYIVYSPESQQYMPEIIRRFNQAALEGRNPVSGQALASGERPIYVWGTDPVTGSSGTVAQGIVNAFNAPNDANVYRPTIYQPSVSHWLALINQEIGRSIFDLAGSRATALSPVIIGIWESRLRAIQQTLGRDDIGFADLLAVLNSPNGWADYGIDAGRRAVFYGHTDPRESSTGLSATIAEFYACARQNGFSDRRLSLEAVESRDVQGCVSNIELLVRHYSRRTEDFLSYIAQGPDYLDFLALEETDLICLNTGGQQGDEVCNRPRERLVAIYPTEGTFWHEHPFGVVNADWVTTEQRDAARIFTDFVLLPDAQRLIMSYGFRPASPDIALEYPFVAENGVTVEGPATVLDVPDAETIIAIQTAWTDVKRPADVLLLVDTSGSMDNEGRLDQAREAILTFLDSTSPNNRVGMLSFSDTVRVWNPLDIIERVEPSLRAHVTCDYSNYNPPRNALFGLCLEAGGSTSLYTATRTAVDVLVNSSDPRRIRAVIVLSDGQDTCNSDGCSSVQAVISKIEGTRSTLNPVMVIPLAYGSDADLSTLNAIARASFSTVFSGDPSNISDLLAFLSGYF
jgi:Ca-activated chloride channel family protein